MCLQVIRNADTVGLCMVDQVLERSTCEVVCIVDIGEYISLAFHHSVLECKLCGLLAAVNVLTSVMFAELVVSVKYALCILISVAIEQFFKISDQRITL